MGRLNNVFASLDKAGIIFTKEDKMSGSKNIVKSKLDAVELAKLVPKSELRSLSSGLRFEAYEDSIKDLIAKHKAALEDVKRAQHFIKTFGSALSVVYKDSDEDESDKASGRSAKLNSGPWTLLSKMKDNKRIADLFTDLLRSELEELRYEKVFTEELSK